MALFRVNVLRFILRVSCVVFPRCSGIAESPTRLTHVHHTNSVVVSGSLFLVSTVYSLDARLTTAP